MSERTKRLLAYIAQQGSQASTWRGLILVVTGVLGLKMPLEHVTEIVSVGLAAAGLIGVFFPDTLSIKKPDEPKEAP